MNKVSLPGKISASLYVKFFFSELLKAILRAPVIYYSTGLMHMAHWVREKTAWYARVLQIGLSFKTLFKPLYQDYTKAGRLTGFLIRSFLLIFRLIGFVFVMIYLGFIFILYGILPFVIIYLFIKTPSILSF